MQWGFALLFYFFNDQIPALKKKKAKGKAAAEPWMQFGLTLPIQNIQWRKQGERTLAFIWKKGLISCSDFSHLGADMLLQCFQLFSRRVAIHLGNLKEQIFLFSITRETDPELQPLPDRLELLFKSQGR